MSLLDIPGNVARRPTTPGPLSKYYHAGRTHIAISYHGTDRSQAAANSGYDGVAYQAARRAALMNYKAMIGAPLWLLTGAVGPMSISIADFVLIAVAVWFMPS